MDTLIRLLAGLGTDAGQVAATLQAHGVWGVRGAGTFDNPVVRYLHRNVDVDGRLEVRDGAALVLVRAGTAFRLDLPVLVRAFLNGFDRGLYPHLEKL